jgi:hypothetical protein
LFFVLFCVKKVDLGLLYFHGRYGFLFGVRAILYRALDLLGLNLNSMKIINARGKNSVLLVFFPMLFIDAFVV